MYASRSGSAHVGVDVELDDVGVEAAVRERVERVDLEAVLVEHGPQAHAVVGRAREAVREHGRHPQPDAQHVQARGLAHGRGVAHELVEHPVEVLGRVDVGAVRQQHGGALPRYARAPRSTEEPSNSTPGVGRSPSTKPGTGSSTRLPDCP